MSLEVVQIQSQGGTTLFSITYLLSNRKQSKAIKNKNTLKYQIYIIYFYS